MSKLMGHIDTVVNQAGDDEAQSTSVTTLFGLPGAGRKRASMSSVHFTVRTLVYDDMRCYMGFSGEISDAVAASSSYPVQLNANASDWNWAYTGGHLVGPTGGAVWTADLNCTNGTGANAPSWAGGKSAHDASQDKGSYTYGWFRWIFSYSDPPQTIAGTEVDLPQGYKYIGQLTQFGGSGNKQDGIVYLGGTGSYSVNDPLYPDPLPITIPGFLQYLDYYPFAIRKSGTMQSANRTGGSTRIRKSGSWRDVKNVAAGTGNDKAFVRTGGSWVKAPKIGANAN